MASHRRYKLSPAMKRFFPFLAALAPNYRWSIHDGAIRAHARGLRNGECVEGDAIRYCPLTAACPSWQSSMAAAYNLARHFGLSVQEGRDIMIAADTPRYRTVLGTRKRRVVAALRPLLLAAVGLLPDRAP